MPSTTVALPGSEVRQPPGSRAAGPVPADQPISATVILRRRAPLPPPPAAGTLPAGGTAPGPARPTMTRAELAARYGADPADIAAIEGFARDHGLRVTGADTGRRTVTLAGTVREIGDAFGVDLQLWEHPGGAHRGYSGPIRLPPALAGVVEAVLGLDDLPAARPR